MARKRKNKKVKEAKEAKETGKKVDGKKPTYKKVVIKDAKKKKQKGFFINGYVVVLILVLILAVVFFAFNFDNIFKKSVQEIPTCGDGSFYDTCSTIKPYLCEKGLLVKAARFCGCPNGLTKSGDACVNNLDTGAKQVSLSYFLDGEGGQFDLSLYKGLYDSYSNVSRIISYGDGEKVFRVDFEFRKLNEENQKPLLDGLVTKIENTAKSEEDKVRIAVSLVQNIEYGQSDKTISVGTNDTLSYSRYPYEILYEGQGVCQEKSELLAYLLKRMNFGVVLFYNSKENHEYVGIKCPVEQSYWNSGYCFVETSGPSIISDEGIEYAGGIKITTKPDIMFISDGKSLPEGLREYSDADALMKIRDKLEQGKGLSSSDQKKLDELNSYYGLSGVYEA